MKVLVIGGGGREHALCWKLARSPQVTQVFCAPGNVGIAADATCVPIGADDLPALADFAVREGIGLTVVGPEAPLCAGIVDLFRSRGLAVFGPDRQAAQLEGSKIYAKGFMERHGIPTARAANFATIDTAMAYVDREFAAGAAGLVVKADGLAAGKGVIVATDLATAQAGVRDCFAGAFGEAGRTVLVEELLVGEEASILALTDGRSIVALASSQDHKRIGEGDAGPNTGGMGAYSPAPVVDPAMMARIDREVLQRFLAGVQREGLDYRGIIYAGVMVTPAGPKVLEFNVRFGDPETQAVLLRLDSDLAEAMLATVEGRLAEVRLDWSDDPAVCVVMAAGGYPGKYEKGKPISGLTEAAATGAVVFHAGTVAKGEDIVTAGGRVLGVTARGPTIAAAVKTAYAAVDRIHWDGAVCRRDIAHRALARESREG
jgi:phosphoribosylamine--glycine ligase